MRYSSNKLCNLCKQREASIFFKFAVNGKGQSIELCKHCAQLVDEGVVDLAQIHTTTTLQDILNGIMQEDNFAYEAPKKKVCKCGATEDDIVNTGKFGCAECYKTFSNLVNRYVDSLGGKTYSGKMPDHVINPKFKPVTIQDQIAELEAKFIKAKQEDDFAKAIEYQNQIKQLKSKL